MADERMPMTPRLAWKSDNLRDYALELEKRIEAEGEAMKAVVHGAMAFCPKAERLDVIRQFADDFRRRVKPMQDELAHVYGIGCTLVMLTLDGEVAGKLTGGQRG